MNFIHSFADDDHEFINNFDAGDTNMYEQATAAWKEYAALHNPPRIRDGEYYYKFQHGDVDFFVLDTRKHRTPNKEVFDCVGYE